MTGEELSRPVALAYASGVAITEVIADFNAHYGLSPEEPWNPRSRDAAGIVREVDTMAVSLERAILRSRQLAAFAMDETIE